ncbi:flavin reductase family protein [Rhizobium esperanzae]|uniref:Flavin reductase (DIM6/NTAB) family NADH-FMN oxidoreductase RutF n=1 Tax=Rhizobium esperanzae TaxID=1967781 RepID=A0A7W6R300_9HYPH|nr:flavin reductase family protein [Rhizobium esperanzae]MBB4235894.1 flavin reductase (DIM6/NTAB) family NADH-FMN oxidoreductase RutF [Rhizobium esperanzae]
MNASPSSAHTLTGSSNLMNNAEVARDVFRSIAGHWPSGVAVITSVSETDGPVGLTMSAVMSLSVEPLQFLISVDNKSNTLPSIISSGRFCINFMAQGQEAIAMRFASKKGEKFEGLPSRQLESGSVLIEGVLAYADCEVGAVYDGGDHRILVGRVTDMALLGSVPLAYFAGKFRRVTDA